MYTAMLVISGAILYGISKLLERKYPELFEEMDKVSEE